ncbi:hypothetical protein [Streptomyces sp. NPDC006333]|uniref:hypothetical protein n=1 Tax=Streptomyces sp. NPDC006333 TaxID=3156753 RepID=UPI0033B5C424
MTTDHLAAALAFAALVLAVVAAVLAPPLTRKPEPVKTTTAANDERSPDWCHRHNCHRSACPGPN